MRSFGVWVIASSTLIIPALASAQSQRMPSNADKLIEAAIREDTPLVRQLLATGTPVDVTDGDGWTAIHWLALAGSEPEIALALKAPRHNVNGAGRGGVTPLLLAAYQGHTNAVALLIRAGANVNARTVIGSAALGVAAFKGHEQTVSLLIRAGADLNAHSLGGRTPLLLAASQRHAQVQKLLIDAGADVTARDPAGNTLQTFSSLRNRSAKQSGVPLEELRYGCADKLNSAGIAQWTAGQELQFTPRFLAAMGHFSKAAELEPRLFPAFCALATLECLGKGDCGGAIRYVKNGLQPCPSEPMLYATWGSVLLESGTRTEALAQFEKARDLGLCLGPSIYHNIGTSANGKRSVEATRKAVLFAPRHLRAWRNLVVVYRELGQLEHARKAARALLALDPDGKAGEWAKNALSTLGP